MLNSCITAPGGKETVERRGSAHTPGERIRKPMYGPSGGGGMGHDMEGRGTPKEGKEWRLASGNLEAGRRKKAEKADGLFKKKMAKKRNRLASDRESPCLFYFLSLFANYGLTAGRDEGSLAGGNVRTTERKGAWPRV